MGHYKKLYERLKNSPKNVRFEELENLMTRVGGFEVRNESSHYTFSHPDLPDIITVKKENYVKPVYVKRCLKAFDLVISDFQNE